MNGYIMNTSTGWKHVMKRTVGPGKKISLSELYNQYGEKHGIEEGDAFIEWLKDIKLRNSKIWKIVCGEDQKETIDDVVSEIQIQRESNQLAAEADVMLPAPNKMSVQDIVMLSYRKGQEILPKITDLKLLKYAFQEANQLAGKDSLCNILRKRIKDLELGR
ncbi:hypothetical protein KAW18_03525 [candidate division WOR-3 bacterium]|nr:hypothetical protein [candidate division WOR-3 bacterium]